MLIYGSSNYGKTDHLPGLFYVVTEFAHLYFIPLVPAKSYCILDHGNGDQGVPIKMSGRSVLLAYLRGILAPVSVVASIAFIVMLYSFFQRGNGQGGSEVLLITGIVVIVGWLLVFLSYRWNKPTPTRALELGKQVGIPMEVLVEHYINDPRVELLMNSPKDEPSPLQP